jgi:small-conductance mechanosensitive channel
MQLGVGGALAYLLVKEVLTFLKSRNAHPALARVDKVLESVTDALADLKAIAEALKEQTEQLKQMREEYQQSHRQVAEVHEWLHAAETAGANGA